MGERSMLACYRAGTKESKAAIKEVIAIAKNVITVNCALTSFSAISRKMSEMYTQPDAVVIENIEEWGLAELSRFLDQVDTTDKSIFVIVTTNGSTPISTLTSKLYMFTVVENVSSIRSIIGRVDVQEDSKYVEQCEINKIIGDLYG
jgi:hypothetical protein